MACGNCPDCACIESFASEFNFDGSNLSVNASNAAATIQPALDYPSLASDLISADPCQTATIGGDGLVLVPPDDGGLVASVAVAPIVLNNAAIGALAAAPFWTAALNVVNPSACQSLALNITYQYPSITMIGVSTAPGNVWTAVATGGVVGEAFAYLQASGAGPSPRRVSAPPGAWSLSFLLPPLGGGLFTAQLVLHKTSYTSAAANAILCGVGGIKVIGVYV